MAPRPAACSSVPAPRAGEYRLIGLIPLGIGLLVLVMMMARAGPIWSNRLPSRVRPRDRHLLPDPPLLRGPPISRRAWRKRPWTKRTPPATDVFLPDTEDGVEANPYPVPARGAG